MRLMRWKSRGGLGTAANNSVSRKVRDEASGTCRTATEVQRQRLTEHSRRWSLGSIVSMRMGKYPGESVSDRGVETVMEAAFADGLVIRTRSRIMSIALLVADWLRKLRVRESRMVAAALPGDGGDGLGNDGIVWLVDTVEVDHLTALGGENGARKAMETLPGVVHRGILRVMERWGAAR